MMLDVDDTLTNNRVALSLFSGACAEIHNRYFSTTAVTFQNIYGEFQLCFKVVCVHGTYLMKYQQAFQV